MKRSSVAKSIVPKRRANAETLQPVEARQRAATLLASVPGSRAGVTVWAPGKIRHAFHSTVNLSSQMLCFTLLGLVLFALHCFISDPLAGMYWTVAAAGFLWGSCQTIWQSVKQFRELTYVVTDAHGIAITSSQGSWSREWKSIQAARNRATAQSIRLEAPDIIEIDLRSHSARARLALYCTIAAYSELDPMTGLKLSPQAALVSLDGISQRRLPTGESDH